jgi:hypothetical protein
VNPSKKKKIKKKKRTNCGRPSLHGPADFPARGRSSAWPVRTGHWPRQDALAEIGLFPSQELILMLLWDDTAVPKGPWPDPAIGHSTIAKSVRALSRCLGDGKKSTVDGRVTLVFLTDADGSQGPHPSGSEELERKTVQSLTAEEQAQPRCLARKIIPTRIAAGRSRPDHGQCAAGPAGRRPVPRKHQPLRAEFVVATASGADVWAGTANL